jgi:hypothetical protein
MGEAFTLPYRDASASTVRQPQGIIELSCPNNSAAVICADAINSGSPQTVCIL